MESRRSDRVRWLRAFKRHCLRFARRRQGTHGCANAPNAAGAAEEMVYTVPEFLGDQWSLLRQWDEDPALADRVARSGKPFVRIPTRKILSALERPSTARHFVRRYRDRGWDQFLRFRNVVRFIQHRKDELARCGLGVSETNSATVSEEFIAFLLGRTYPSARRAHATLPLTTYIVRGQRGRSTNRGRGAPEP